MNVQPLASNLGFVDLENLFLYGESRGGMMTFLALRQKFPARAAATFGAFTGLERMLETTPKTRQMAEQIWPDFQERKAHYFETRSALRWAEELQAPLLLMHGGADQSVSPDLTLEFARKLQQLGRTYELHVYAGDGHTLRDNQVERDRRAAAWFKRFLQKKSN